MNRMIMRLFMSCVSVAAFSATAVAATVEGNISLVVQQSTGKLSSFSWAQYYDTLGFAHEFYMEGTHSISEAEPGDVDILQWGVQTGRYEGTRQGLWTCGRQYEARNFAKAHPNGPDVDWHVSGGPWTASAESPACPSPRNDPPPPPPEVINPGSPIILNLSGVYSLSGADDPVWFDIDGDGLKDKIGWTSRGSDEVFLSLDRNHDGLIADGTELFGDATPLRDGTIAANGFDALKDFDENGDHAIDARDGVWTELLLWHDADHDGVAEPSELSRISRTTVRAIGLEYHWTGRQDRHGNEFRYRGRLEIDPAGQEQRNVYDIFFVNVP